MLWHLLHWTTIIWSGYTTHWRSKEVVSPGQGSSKHMLVLILLGFHFMLTAVFICQKLQQEGKIYVYYLLVSWMFNCSNLKAWPSVHTECWPPSFQSTLRSSQGSESRYTYYDCDHICHVKFYQSWKTVFFKGCKFLKRKCFSNAWSKPRTVRWSLFITFTPSPKPSFDGSRCFTKVHHY